MLYERAHGHGHHDHLICTECNGVVEFHDEALEKLQQRIAEAHEFEVSWHTHKLFGRCRGCRNEAAPLAGSGGVEPRRGTR